MFAAAVLHASPARADDDDAVGTRRMFVSHYEVSALTGVGGPLALENAAAPRISGVQLVENNGPILQTLAGEKHGYTDDCRDVCSRLEVSAYGPVRSFGEDDGRPRARGFDVMAGAAFKLMKVRAGDGPRQPVMFTMGTGYATLRTPDGAPYRNLGVVFRLTMPITTWLEGFAQWNVNVLRAVHPFVPSMEGTFTSPLRVGATVSIGNRLFVRGIRSVNAIATYGLGWQLEAGVRL